MCHNTNVLEANNSLLLDAYDGSPLYGDLFKKHGIPALPNHDPWHDKDVEDYLAAVLLCSCTKLGQHMREEMPEKNMCVTVTMGQHN